MEEAAYGLGESLQKETIGYNRTTYGAKTKATEAALFIEVRQESLLAFFSFL